MRDREVTSKRLIAAVGSLLAREGFRGIGVNAVAREAGVDKVLIYRYFDGLQGLIAAYGREGDFWPSVLELAGGDLKRFAKIPLAERLCRFAATFVQALRSRPVTRAIMAWEMVERNELTAELEVVREESIRLFFKMFFLNDQKEKDLQAIIMIVGAAVSYLVVRSDHIDLYGGLNLGSEDGWTRLEEAIYTIVKGVVAS